MESSIMDAGLELMVAGMGTVFVFLTTLVFAMIGMSKVALRLVPPAVQVGGDEEEIAAITAAISMHRRRQR